MIDGVGVAAFEEGTDDEKLGVHGLRLGKDLEL